MTPRLARQARARRRWLVVAAVAASLNALDGVYALLVDHDRIGWRAVALCTSVAGAWMSLRCRP